MAKGTVVFFMTEMLEEMKQFYAKALKKEGKQYGPNWCQYRLSEDCIFALHASETSSKHPVFSFEVDDIEASFESFRSAGANVIQGIQDEGFGKTVELQDPEGRKITLVEHS